MSDEGNTPANFLMRGIALCKRCQEPWVVRPIGGGLQMPPQDSGLHLALALGLGLLLLLRECW